MIRNILPPKPQLFKPTNRKSALNPKFPGRPLPTPTTGIITRPNDPDSVDTEAEVAHCTPHGQHLAFRRSSVALCGGAELGVVGARQSSAGRDGGGGRCGGLGEVGP